MSHDNVMFPVVLPLEDGNAEPMPTFGDAAPAKFLPPLKNYAKNEKYVREVQQELLPVIQLTRDNRKRVEEGWREIDSMVEMKHGAGRRYFGRTDLVLPLYRKERQKLVSMLSKGLFPSDDYFDCTDKSSDDQTAAGPVKTYMAWELETNARFRALIKPSLCDLVDYGTAVGKFWYRKELAPRAEGMKLSPAQLGIPGLDEGLNASFTQKPREGVAYSPRKLTNWYIYPETAESLDDASMVFEDISVNLAFLEGMKRSGLWENVDAAMAAYSTPEFQEKRTSFLSLVGMSDNTQQGGKYALQPTLTEIWTFMQLPAAEYMEWEDTAAPIPVKVVVSGDFVLEIRRNPFFHQRPPYVVGRTEWTSGFFYGRPTSQLIAPLQALATDFFNQVNDNGILSLNPITLYNPGLMQGPLRPFAPGVPYPVSDVNNSIRFERPPTEQASQGLAFAQTLMAMAQDFGGSPPDRSTQSKGAKTATGMQILQRNAAIPLQDTVEDLELDMMVPMLYGSWKNAVQYRDKEVMAVVAGKQPLRISPEMLAIDADFKWMASSQTSNNQVRSQQAIQMIQMMLPLVPMLMQQGYVVDFTVLLRKVFNEGFGFRGFDHFIRRAEAAPSTGMPGPEQMPGIAREQGDRMRSALEQVPGNGQVDAVPGEAEEFMAVRGQADDLAAMLGVTGGAFGEE